MDGTASIVERRVAFKNPKRFLADLDPVMTGKVIASAADVALVIEKGVIKDIAVGNEELAKEGYERTWRGKPWVETVTIESRPKIEDLLSPSKKNRWRQVNHPSSAGIDVPVRYTTVKAAGDQRLVALGRDLRSVAMLQQRLVEAHQELERDYSRLREAEARYKLLFQSVSQPVLIVDPATLEVEEANPAAAAALRGIRESLVGASLRDLFQSQSHRGLDRAIADAMGAGSTQPTSLQLKDGSPCELDASAFRQDDSTRAIVRLQTAAADQESTPASPRGILGVLEDLPDGFVVAAPDLRILAANRAFVEMAQLMSQGQLVGGQLSDFLGRSSTDLNVLVSSLKNHGVVRNFTTALRDRFGNQEEVEVSAVEAPLHDDTAYGFSVRRVARRLRTSPSIGEKLPSSADQLTGLVGRVPLKEIVRESTDLIERLCIEAALEITSDNRASAAQMLGLSRQGLYSKLKRFGFDDQN